VKSIYGEGGGPTCCVLELESTGGSMRVLLDCGWTSSFQLASLKSLQEVLPSISLVLISSGDLNHIGALPFAVSHGLSRTAGIYATFPAAKLGQMALYDAFLSKEDEGGIDGLFTLDDVDNAVERIKTLKYDERLQVRFDRVADTLISPRVGGRLLGGAFWHLRYGVEEIVYASSFGWGKSLMVGGASASLGKIRRPALLITDAQPAMQFADESKSHLKPEERERETHRVVLETLRKSGNVLVPCDAAGRALELLYSLNKLWEAQRLYGNYKLVFLSHTSYNTVEFAKCLMEWVSRDLAEVFEMETRNPYALKYTYQCHSLAEVERVMARFPVCVVCTDADMMYGFSKALLEKWASDPFSLILTTQRGGVGYDATTASPLVQLYQGERTLKIHVPIRVKRSEDEIIELHRSSTEKQQQLEAAERLQESVQEMEKEIDLLDDSDEEEEPARRGVKRNRLLLFDRFAKKTHPVFEDVEAARQRPRVSPYGLELQDDELEVFRRHEAVRTGTAGTPFGESVSSFSASQQPSLRREASVGTMSDAGPENVDGNGTTGEDDTLYKVVLEPRQIEINCQVSPFLDWSGYTTTDSREAFLKQIRPKNILLLNTERKHIARLRRSLLRDKAPGGSRQPSARADSSVRAPADEEDVSCDFDTSFLDVAVENRVASDLSFQRISGSDTLVASLSGALAPTQQGLALQPGAREETLQQVEVKPKRDTFLLSAKKVDVAAVKRALDEHGVASVLKFSKDRKSSMLVVDNAIVVRVSNERSADKPIEVDGPACPAYFRVRRAIYSTSTQVHL